MGLLQRLGNWRLDDGVDDRANAAEYLLGGTPNVARVADLPASIAAAFGLTALDERVDRTVAMRRPTVRRARQAVVGTIGAQTLQAHRYNGDGTVDNVTAERPLITQPNPNTTLQYELTWTVDDLWFYGVSWWRVIDRDPQGYPKNAERLAPYRVTVDLAEGRVYVDGKPAADRDLIRFDGPDEGVLAYGGPTFATGRLVDGAVRKFASLDIPQGALTPKDGAQNLSYTPGSCGIEGDERSEVDLLLDVWEESRRARTTAYLNGAVDYQTYTLDAAQTELAEARSQQRVDDANVCNVPPRIVNAPSNDSMTYSTVQAERVDLVDLSMAGLIVAIEQRLSLGDVTPRGTVVRLDLTRFLQGDTKTALEAARLAFDMQAITADEIRTEVLGRTPLTNGDRA